MTDYKNQTIRLADIGLNLRNSPDKVSEGEWRILENVRPATEGQLQTRDGYNTYYDLGAVDDVHSLFRTSTNQIVIGEGTELAVTSGTISPTGLPTGEPDLSGNPLTFVSIQPSDFSAPLTYVGDSSSYRVLVTNPAGNQVRQYKWGISSPTVPSTYVSGGAGNLNSAAAGASTYDWRYTYKSTVTGAQSNPSPEGASLALNNESAEVAVTASTDPQVDKIRIYRRGGTQVSTWRFVVEVNNATAIITDNNSDEDIATNDGILLDNDVPFTSVSSSGVTQIEQRFPYIAGPFLGKYIIACGDPNRLGAVYWTNADRPYSADTANYVFVTQPQEPLIASVVFDSLPWVFSRGNLYALDYGGPGAEPLFQPRRTTCGRGLIAPWAFTTEGPAIFFVSQDGIYHTTGGEATAITEEDVRPIFYGQYTGYYYPIDLTLADQIRLSYIGKELHFFYPDTNGGWQHLIWHSDYNRWRSESANNSSTQIHLTLGYNDPNQTQVHALFGANVDGNIEVWERQNGVAPTYCDYANVAVEARTGSFDQGLPQTFKEYGGIVLDCDLTNVESTIAVNVWTNAEQSNPITYPIFGSLYTGRVKVPINLQDTYAYSLALDFSWTTAGGRGLLPGPETQGDTPVIYQVDFLWRPDEEAITHWEYPPTSHGFEGWQHVRDWYIALRSTDQVIPTFIVDGVSYTPRALVDGVEYDYIPSTDGARKKIYLHCPPVKGKMFSYKLDSVGNVLAGIAPFRLYGEDCEVRVKQWNTSLGYQLISPFSATSGGT